jgi:predicted protein tyrosine phosphatase
MGRLSKGLHILWGRLSRQGVRVTSLWAVDHMIRALTGAPIRRLSQIVPQVHVGGQYRRRGWSALSKRGITAVVNMRSEFDDARAGIAPGRYLYLPTEDDHPPTLEALRAGAAFISEEVARGGTVYIHCGAGVGRAPVMAAAYLVSTGLTPGQAWEQIRRARPFIRPYPAQVEQVEVYAREVKPAGLAVEDAAGQAGPLSGPQRTLAEHQARQA